MKKLVDLGSVGAFFGSYSDPRHTQNRKHLLGEMIVIAVYGLVAVEDNQPKLFVEIEEVFRETIQTDLALEAGCSFSGERQPYTRTHFFGNNLRWLRQFVVGLLKAHPIKDSISGKKGRRGITNVF